MNIIYLFLQLYFARYVVYLSKNQCGIVRIVYCAVVVKLLLYTGYLNGRLKCYLRSVYPVLPCHQRLKVEPFGKPAGVPFVELALLYKRRYVIGSPRYYNNVLPEFFEPFSEALKHHCKIVGVLKVIFCNTRQLLYPAFKLGIISRSYIFRKEILAYDTLRHGNCAYLYDFHL